MSRLAGHMALDVLVVEPWFGGSHRGWADGLAAASAHRVRLVTHEAAHWRWRMAGGSVTLADEVRADVAVHGPPDVTVVSGMVDLAALLGLLRGVTLGPVVLYLHENQLTYPVPPGGTAPRAEALANWRSLLAADAVWCNSAFQRGALAEALPRLLADAPDHSHLPLVDGAVGRIEVVPVGVDVERIPPRVRDDLALVVWNQRWEYDKCPERALAALVRVAEMGRRFRVALCGERPAARSAEAERAVVALGGRIVHDGHLPDSTYVDVLSRSAIVLSTADHENFGVAVVEAMAGGALPVVPADLAYPEVVPRGGHERCLYRRDDGPDGALLWALDNPEQRDALAARLAVEVRSRASWSAVAPDYDRRLVGLVRAWAR